MEIKYSLLYKHVLQTHLRLFRHAIKFEALEKLGGQFLFFLFLALAVGGLPGPGPKLN